MTTEGGKVHKTDKDSASLSLYSSGVTRVPGHGTDSSLECDEGSTKGLKAKNEEFGLWSQCGASHWHLLVWT